MKHPKLRIAWSVAWGIVATLLIALWIRSYWIGDFCQWSSQTRNHDVQSNAGSLFIERYMFFSGFGPFCSGEFPARRWEDFTSWPRPVAGIGLNITDRGWCVIVSLAWPLVFAALLAAGPWISLVPRFSLRTLLIAITLVAVGLGLIVYVGGK